ncbi:MAG: hypothetical protein AB1601_12280 [Planctomycetota bacterium]
MTSKSILDLDEARRRLQLMESDQKELAALITKLRGIRDSLTTLTSSVEQRLKDAEGGLAKTQQLADGFEKTLKEFRQESESTLADFFTTGTRIESKLTKLIDETKVALGKMQVKTTKDNEAWRLGQEKALEAFRDQHHADLEKVATAYERTKITFDNLKPAVDGLEAEVSRVSEEARARAETTRSDLLGRLSAFEQRVAKMKETVQAAQAQVSYRLTEFGSNLEKQIAEVTKSMHTAIDDSSKASQQQLEQQKAEITRLRKRIGRVRLLVWLLLLLVLGVTAVWVAADGARWPAYWDGLVAAFRRIWPS